jgi:hypothetical protein
MRGFSLGAILSIALGASAHADWQYTKWGMTPAEVAAASGGAVKVVRPSAESVADKTSRTLTECSGDYIVGKFHFYVVFSFDRQKHQLEEVTLLLPDHGYTDELRRALEEKYGAWREGMAWIDRNDGYSVELISADVSMIHYRPLHDAEKNGL